jgi:hypothetical protein
MLKKAGVFLLESGFLPLKVDLLPNLTYEYHI